MSAKKVSIYIFLIVLGVFFFIPFYWMISTSLKSEGEIFLLRFWPSTAVVENYKNLFQTTSFVNWLISGLIVSSGTVCLGIFLCSIGGYAFAKYKFKGRNLIFWMILSTVAIPEIVTIVPIFVLMVRLHLVDTYSALILPFSVNVFGMFLMKQYIAGAIPDDLLDSARMDGCSEIGLLFRIVFPLVRPGLAILGIFLWLDSWSSYFWPLIMLKSENKFTVPLGLATLYANPWNIKYGLLMAGAFLSTLPMILVFAFMQEQFISGLTEGALK